MDADNHQETQEFTQEREYSSEGTDDCTEVTEDYTQSTVGSNQPSQSANSNFKHFPAACPCSKYDSDSRHTLIQGAYDAAFVAARRKKAAVEKQRKMKKTKAKKLNKDVTTVQRKQHAASLKASDDTVPPKKRQSTKKYDPIDTPGQTKLTTFVTSAPAPTKQSIPTSVEKPSHDTPTTVGTSESSVSFKSPKPTPEPTFHSPAAANQNATSTGSDETVLHTPRDHLPSMLACCVGVCNGCKLQFYKCHKQNEGTLACMLWWITLIGLGMM